MTKYNPQIHHRRSIRLKGYDYAQAGLYFITICCQGSSNRMWLPFGNVVNGEMILNDAGKMIEKWYYELENKYPDKRCHEMVVMPNHFHCIIENLDVDGANTRDANTRNAHGANTVDAHVGTSLRGHPEQPDGCTKQPNGCPQQPYGIHNKQFQSPIGNAVGWFKTMTTNAYIHGVKHLGWQPFNGKLWQRNYYEHIIRDQRAYLNISHYIINNPSKWDDDRFYMG